MSMMLDLIVLAVIVISAIIYTRKGLVKSLLGFASFFISLILAYVAIPILMPLLETPIAKALGDSATSDGSLSDLLKTDMTAAIIAKVISFIILFVLITVLVKLLILLIDRVFKLPVLNKANKTLGFVLGLLIGLFYAQLLSIFFFAFSEFLLATQDWITPEAFEGSVVARFLFDFNIFKLLFSL